MRLRRAFAGIRPTPEEVARELSSATSSSPEVGGRGHGSRAFTLAGSAAETCGQWFVCSLGKAARGGWYLTRTVERVIPRSRRALRRLDRDFSDLAVGDVIPDWGGRDATFQIVALEAPSVLVHRSTRGSTNLSWAIVLRDGGTSQAPQTRVALRLRLGPVRHRVLAKGVGGLFDALTIAGLAAGLRERLAAGQDRRLTAHARSKRRTRPRAPRP